MVWCNTRAGVFACMVALAGCSTAKVLLAACGCMQECKQVTAISSTVGSCRAFSPATCYSGTAWVSGGAAGYCVAVSPQVNISWYSCANGCTDSCAGCAGTREYAPPANYDNGIVCTVNGTIPQYECVGTQ